MNIFLLTLWRKIIKKIEVSSKAMSLLKPITTAVAALGLALGMMASRTAQADTFGSGANTFTIDFINIGNAGNAADTTGYGAVPYEYRMGTYEITQNAIDKATAAGMTNVTAGAWSGNLPAANISWFEAAAFVNWLNTSQGHQAAYDLTWTGSEWSMTLWSSSDAWQLGGENPYRHKDAYYFLPSEDEWYKAAYYNPAGEEYFLYATGSNTNPAVVSSGTEANTAVYGFQSQPAAVNLSGGLSPYGTMGQNGNVWEWAESAYTPPSAAGSSRVLRAGSYNNAYAFFLESTDRYSSHPWYEADNIGLRVASVPEPSTALLMMLGGAGMLVWKRIKSVL